MQTKLPIRLSVVLALLFLAAPSQAAGELKKTVKLDIPAQPLSPALILFSGQTNIQVITRAGDISRHRTKGVSGRMSVEEALRKLLEGTGFSYIAVGDGTVEITASPAAGQTNAGAPASASLLRLARVEAPGAAAGDDQDAVGEDAANEEAARGVPEILVKGRRSANVDIRRTEDDIQPYVVFEAEEIQNSMAGTLEDFLRMRLPMNTTIGTNGQNVVGASAWGNISEINLRGLGSNQTLILVNGRRMPGVAEAGDFMQPDINGIALSSIERIEVLPSTAGGLYGGGATGGVINIILKSDHRGLEMNVRYDNTFDTDVARRRVDVLGGFALEGGRTHLTFTASASDGNTLARGDRDFGRKARALQLSNNPAAFYGANPPLGATSNIRSTTGVPLVLRSTGESIGANFTHVPYGYAGPHTDGGLALAQNAGQYNLDMPTGLGGDGGALTTVPVQASVTVNARRSFSDRVEVFFDGALLRNHSESEAMRRLNTTPIVLPAAAPNNPFLQPIRVTFPASDLTYGAEASALSETLRAGLGAILRLPHDWTVHLQFDWNESRRDFRTANSPLTAAGNTALTNGTLDILRDVIAHPLDYSPYYFTPVPSYLLGPMKSTLLSPTLRLSGQVARLPAGDLRLAGALEHQEMELDGNLLTNYTTPDVPTYTYYPPRGQETTSVYAELTAPLLSPAMGGRWGRSLDLQLSYRGDRTRTRSVRDLSISALTGPSPDGPFPEIVYGVNRVQASQYTLGFRYQPVDDLTMRVSFGSGILPPSTSQLVPLIFNEFPVFVQDPHPQRQGDVIMVVNELRGQGSMELDPERSRSWSAGLIFTPSVLPGLRLSVDYTRIEKHDEIGSVDLMVLLERGDEYFPGRVVRGPLTQEDIEAGYGVGPVISIDQGLVNIAYTDVQAWDMQADYRWATQRGRFRAYAVATWQPHLRRRLIDDAPLVEAAGFAGLLKWRGNAGINWDWQGWSVGWNMQYYGSVRIYSSEAAQSQIDTAVLNQGSHWYPRQIYHDLFVKHRFGHLGARHLAWLNDSELMAGVSNVLDTEPPIVATTNPLSGGYHALGDPRLRRYSVTFRKNF